MQNLKGLYVIADAECIGTKNIVSKTEEVLAAGVRIIQYRDKINSQEDQNNIATELSKLTKKYASLFIINDDVQLAAAVNADGVHLGRNDVSIKHAKNILGKDKIIGASCYEDLKIAQQAVNDSASYIAFGSFFPSKIKPAAPRANIDLLRQTKMDHQIPICAIGGITPENATSLLDAGADMIAVISSVFSASSPTRAVQEYLSLF